MSTKSRVLRILLAVLLVLAFIGYFTFQTVFFAPFEGGLGVDLAGLVPRDVDVFVARAQLAEEFDGFPRLAIADDLEANETYRLWRDSPEGQAFLAEVGLDELLARVDRELAQLPAGIDPVRVFGGEDLALAVNLKGRGLETSDWAAYGTLSAAGKLAIELLSFPSWIGLDAQGILADEGEGYVTLSGGPLARPLVVARIRDVGIVSTSEELVQEALSFEARSFQDSMLASGTYHDEIQLAERSPERDELELVLDARALSETFQLTGAWPDGKSQDFLPAFAARFFQVGLVNRLVGIVGLDDGLELDLQAQLSSELMTSLQTRVYRQRAVSAEELVDRYAVFAPEDAGLFLYFKCDIGDFLTAVLDSIEPTTRGLIEDRFRAQGKYRTLAELVEDVDEALLDHFVLILRDNDYPEEAEGPVHNGLPVPAFTVIGWLADGGKAKIDELRSIIGRMGSQIGLQGREPGQSGFYSNSIGGHEFNEYWSPAIDGTGVISAGTTSEHLIVTNTVQGFNHVHKTWTQGAPQFPRLSERTDFQALARGASHGANLAVWVNPGSMLPLLRRMADQWASDSLAIDWSFERQRIEDRLLREQYGGRRKGELGSLEQGDFERAVEDAVDALDREIRRTQLPLARERFERRFAYLAAVRGALLMVGADPKELDVTLRVVAPLD
jgi:hypothetical protein